jgi:hypothetical protein
MKLHEKSSDKETRHIVAALNIFFKAKEPSKINFYFRQLATHLKELQCDTFQRDLVEITHLGML